MNKIKWIFLFIFFATNIFAQSNLSGYEYWFNDEYTNKQSVQFAPTTNHQLDGDIDVGHLPEGLNRFALRYKDENGLFSSTYTKLFLKHTLENLTEYEYWFNNDIQNKQIIALPPANQHQLTADIDVSHLPGGINIIHVRYKGNNGLYSSAQSKAFLHIPENKQLVGYEYWFNNNFDHRIGHALSPATQHQVIETINVSDLNDGLNTFSFRVKDNRGFFSSPITKYFYKDEDLMNESSKLTSWEYWFNNDYDNRVETVFTPAGNQAVSTSIDATAMPEGVNVLNIRFKDETGKYSVTVSELFYRKSFTAIGSNNMVAWEYWFNNDYENRVEAGFTPASQQDFTTSIDASALPGGVNVLNIRFKDEEGKYSVPISEIIFKNTHEILDDNKIFAYRYRLEDENGVVHGGDPETGYTMTIPDEPVNPATIDLNIDLADIPRGTYHFLFEAFDSLGLKSVTTTDTIVKTAFPVADFSVENNPACSNTPVRFLNQSIDADTCFWDFGDGSISHEYEPEHVFETAGQYEVFLTATDSVTGRDSTISQIIDILPSAFSEEFVEICQGDTLYWNGYEYTETGVYDAVLSAENGCDSTVTLHLTVNPSYNVFYSDESSENEYLVDEGFEETPLNTFPADWVIRYEGTGYDDQYVVDTPVKMGSRSLKVSGSGWAANLSKSVSDIPDKVILEGWMRAENVASGGRCGLGIGNPDIGSWGAYWARVEFYEGNLITYYYTGSSGGYGTQYVLQPASPNTWYHVKIVADAAIGTYQVYINGEQAGAESGGQTITAFPLYTNISAESVEIYGNSLVYFDDIKLYEGDNGFKSICSNELPFVFGTQNLTESGEYTETFQTTNGCDSIVTINLEVKQAYDLTDEVALCENELPYIFGSQTLTETGEYTETWSLDNGCDSTVTLSLTVFSEYEVEARKAICLDSTYLFGSQLITEAGVYEELFQTVHGCDSLVTLTVQTAPGNIEVSNQNLLPAGDDCFNGFYTIAVAGDGYPVTVEPDAMVDFVAGSSIRFLPGFHAKGGSYVNAYITTEPWFCESRNQSLVAAPQQEQPDEEKSATLITGIETAGERAKTMVVYPNPNNGEFTVEFRNFENKIRVMLFNSIGQLVHDELTSEKEIRLRVPNLESGMYFIKAVDKGEQNSKKIIVR